MLSPVIRLRHLTPALCAWYGALSDLRGWVRLACMEPWIVADSAHLGGSPRVRGTRISVSLILESLAAGMTVEQIVDAFPSLTEESVRGVLTELAHRKDLQPA
jgi:uncharacterized protein (DUF433 family)